MTYYVAVGNRSREYYSISELREGIREESKVFDLLKERGSLYCIKENEKSRVHGDVIINASGKIKFVKDYKEELIDGAYGS